MAGSRRNATTPLFAGQDLYKYDPAKARALLAYLAVEHDQAHRRERLAGLLWPDYPESAARANLRAAAEELQVVSSQMDDNSSETSRQVNSVSAASVDVSRNVETVSAGTDEMSVSIKEIADLLRHRDVNTARVYARVDLERLRTVALPWPGSAS